MTRDASCPGPCRRDRCPRLALIVFCLLVAAPAVVIVSRGVASLRAAADARMAAIEARVAREADRLDADIHAAHRRVAELSRALDAERAARRGEAGRRDAEVARETHERKAAVARLDARIADALTRDVVELGEVVMGVMRRLDAAEKRIALQAASCSCTADRPAPKPTPVPTPKTPAPPGKTLPEAVPPAPR